jgi:hypothetical protein
MHCVDDACAGYELELHPRLDYARQQDPRNRIHMTSSFVGDAGTGTQGGEFSSESLPHPFQGSGRFLPARVDKQWHSSKD